MSVERIRIAQGKQGFALIVILLVVAIFAALMLAYFSQATLGRQISLSSSGQARASIIANTAVATIEGDLIDEMRAGSTPAVDNSVTVFDPKSNFTVPPQKVGSNGVTNLVKVSEAATLFWATSGNSEYRFDGPVRSAVNNSTESPAIGGRYISENRWLQSALVSESEKSNMPVPDWVLVTRRGVISDATSVPSLGQLSDRDPDNMDYAVGRFAYAIYDQGALLDVTVAGHAGGLTSEQLAGKGLLGLADLTQIPNGSGGAVSQTQVDELVAWRNANTSANYYDYLTGSGIESGFLSVSPGDQTFLSRRDLINYAETNGLSAALPYLTTFTRVRNAPSWSPPYDAVDLGGVDYAYESDAQSDAAINRGLANVRANDGSPLIKKRFPLSRLSLLDGSGSEGDLEQYFGLKGSDAAGWTYDHGSSSRIFTLEEVAVAGREPDFFELLKAVILEGSLGRTAVDSYVGAVNDTQNTMSRPDLNIYKSTDNQIIQIGANIIDQYDSGNFPSTISFNGNEFYGIENLPYMTRMIIYFYNDPDDPNQPAARSSTNYVTGSWLRPELWKLHQDPGTTTAGEEGPSRLRIQLLGVAFTNVLYDGASHPGPTVDFTANPDLGRIEFDPDKIPHDHPAALSVTSHGATSSSSLNLRTEWPDDPAMVYTGFAPMDAPPGQAYGYVRFTGGGQTLSAELQWQDDAGEWHTYSRLDRMAWSPQNAMNPNGYNHRGNFFYGKVDPRTDRFGTSASWIIRNLGGQGNYGNNLTLRPTTDPGYAFPFCPPTASGFSVSSGNFYLGSYSQNITSQGDHYSDRDGIVRRASGAYAVSGIEDGYPLMPIITLTDPPANDSSTLVQRQTPRRPLILNRPFRSVGELGYAFRDLPFKNLDFFTQESADAGLLDVFSVYDEPEFVAGRVSLNTPYPEVLQAVLQGAGREEYDATAVLNSEVSDIADAIVQHTTDPNKGPFMNRGDLVTELSDELTAVFSESGTRSNKIEREAYIRGLADVSDTRTWNLLIDVVAQAGRYPTSASNLNDFDVQGERHYWVHVAIDRFTGEIIDRKYEDITE